MAGEPDEEGKESEDERAVIRRRLERVRGDLSDADFDALVEKVFRNDERGRERLRKSPWRRPAKPDSSPEGETKPADDG